MIIKTFFHDMFVRAVELNHRNIESLFEQDTHARFVDLGCDDGVLTRRFAERIGTEKIWGIDLVDERLSKAKRRGIKVIKSDLNKTFRLNRNSCDVIHANQVIEHITDSDKFIKEIFHALKPGGYAIISTENASSWCNIVSTLFGWQIFSLTNFSGIKASIGNPFAIHRDDQIPLTTWHHVRIYSIFGLKEYFEVTGFTVESILGAGYFPLPAFFGKIDPVHAHFITYKIRKSSS